MRRWSSTYPRTGCYQEICLPWCFSGFFPGTALYEHIPTALFFSIVRGCTRKLTYGVSVLRHQKLSHDKPQSFTKYPALGVYQQTYQHKTDPNSKKNQNKMMERERTFQNLHTSIKRNILRAEQESRSMFKLCLIFFFLLWTNLKFWELQHPLKEAGCWDSRYFKKRSRCTNDIFINKRMISKEQVMELKPDSAWELHPPWWILGNRTRACPSEQSQLRKQDSHLIE